MNILKNESNQLVIWVDNDGCPQKTREILFKAARREKIKNLIKIKLVANRYFQPPAPNIEMLCVSRDFDAADKKIAADVSPEDIVITADIPLADLCVAKKAIAISPHGDLYTAESIKEKLAYRNLNQELRSAGLIQGGGGSYGGKAVQQFANAFDRILTQQLKKRGLLP